MATASETKVIEAYIGLLGRAPDPSGLTYWTAQLDAAGGTTDALKKLTNDITLSAEWDAGLGAQKQADGSISQANANKIVGDMYLNLFERAASAADLTYWGDQLIAATVTPSEMAVLLIAAANENGTADGQTLGFKTQAATYYVEGVSQADFTRTTATNSVKDVAGPQSLADSKEATDAITTGVGVTAALTTAVDTVAMTGGDDTVTGTNLTMATGDIIVDSSTTDSDVLTLAADGAFVLGTVTNVETINVNIDATRAAPIALTGGATVTGTGSMMNVSTAATTTVNGQSIAGETRVTLDSLAMDVTTTGATAFTATVTTNDAITVTGDASLATLTAAGTATNDTFTAVLANNDATLDYTGNAGDGDSVRVTAGGKLQLDAATIETITILGKDEALAVDLNSATAVNLNVGGDQNVTITAGVAALGGSTLTDITTAGTTALVVEGTGGADNVALNKAGILSGGISLNSNVEAATVTGGNTVTLKGVAGATTITANDSGTSDGKIDLVLDSNPVAGVTESGFETIGITTNDSVDNISLALTSTSTSGNDTTITLTAGNDVGLTVASSGAGGAAVNAGVTGAYTDAGSVLDHDVVDTVVSAATYTAVATGAVQATVDARAAGATAAVSLTSTSNDVTTTVTLVEENDTNAVTLDVTAGQDITLTNVTINGGGAGSAVTATAARELTTGDAISAALVVGGADISLEATSNDINLDDTLTSVGTVAAGAAGDITLTAGQSILGAKDLDAGDIGAGGTVAITTGALGSSAIGNIDANSVTIGAGNDVSVTSVDATVVVVTGAGDVGLGNVKSYNVSAANATGAITAVLTGDAGNATGEFTSGSGNDVLTLNDATVAYTASTGAGIDNLTVTAAAASTVNLGEGNDIAAINSTTATRVTINGDAGVDTLSVVAAADNDVFNGGAGNDKVIFAGAIAANGFTVDGGADNDTVTLAAADYTADTAFELKNIEVVDITAGNATLSSESIDNDSSFELMGGNSLEIAVASGDTMDASNITFVPGAVSAITFTAAAGNETITGTALANTIDGLGGNDIISGAAGADILSGSAGTDTLNGDAGDDVLAGGAGADILNGGADSDTITGGQAADIIDGGLGTDTVSYADVVAQNTHLDGDGVDGVTGMAINLSSAAITAATVAAATGNVLAGGAGAAGASLAAGSAGYLVAVAGDSVVGHIRDTITGVENITGSALKDYIVGSSAANAITGGLLADNMTGGAGADAFGVIAGQSTVLTAETVAEANAAATNTITFGNGLDVITDFVNGAGGDTLDTTADPITGIGVDFTADNSAASYFFSGNYVEETGLFTITADGAGADTLIFNGDGTANLAGINSFTLLVGVSSAALDAANFI